MPTSYLQIDAQLVLKPTTNLPYKKLYYQIWIMLSTCLDLFLQIVFLNGMGILFKIIQITHLKNRSKHFTNGSKL